ncbi:MAG: ribonuclease H-like domain-containing protein [Firmicutes bacterium]|nr:ribonuclease H-like domain-containing protein [Bacillota bacterium]
MRNPFGTCLRIRRWFPVPELPAEASHGLRLLAPEAPESAARLEDWLFLDTETTGLAGGTGTYAFLVGVGWWDGFGLAVEQYLMRDFTEEHALLAALAEQIERRPVLVSFNGKSFDWPLLETRFRLTRVLAPPPLRAHLDLLHPARQLWSHRAGGPASVRLIELERDVLGFAALGYDRRDDFPSALIPQAYFDYLRGGPAAPLAAIVHHNQRDLRGLAALAARIFALAATPEAAVHDPREWFGLSRLFHRRREHSRARQFYERALAAGLPGVLERAAQRELARLAKRERDYTRANELWWQLLAAGGHPDPTRPLHPPDTPRSADRQGHRADASARPNLPTDLWTLDAYEQLAIFYEHQARNPQHAAALTRAALEALRTAVRVGTIEPARVRKYKARLEHRLARLEVKSRSRTHRLQHSPTARPARAGTLFCSGSR